MGKEALGFRVQGIVVMKCLQVHRGHDEEDFGARRAGGLGGIRFPKLAGIGGARGFWRSGRWSLLRALFNFAGLAGSQPNPQSILDP